MSLYNMMFGQSKNVDALLSVLGLTKDSFYRFRDCYLAESEAIAVYTRGGGNNREDDERADVIRLHPCYLRDEDDDFDNTYATFYFRIPEEADRAALEDISPEIARNEAWLKLIEALRNASAPPVETK